MSMTMYGRELLLKLLLTGDTTPRPVSLAIALTLNVPTANADVSQLVEPSAATTYQRQPYSLGSAFWLPTSFGALYNAQLMTFPRVGVVPWGMLAGYALLDSALGQCIDVGALSQPMSAVVGIIPLVKPGALVLGIRD